MDAFAPRMVSRITLHITGPPPVASRLRRTRTAAPRACGCYAAIARHDARTQRRILLEADQRMGMG